MKEQEQNLLDAAREIVYDFNHYGEVLQTGDNGEYGTESSIGMLSTAIHQYKNSIPAKSQHGRESDEVKPLAQYLSEHINDELDYDVTWRELLEQILDAYENAEQVKIRIEKV